MDRDGIYLQHVRLIVTGWKQAREELRLGMTWHSFVLKTAFMRQCGWDANELVRRRVGFNSIACAVLIRRPYPSSLEQIARNRSPRTVVCSVENA